MIDRHFGDLAASLDGADYRSLLETALRANISGGAIYDALVAATARAVGSTLVSFDLRAVRAYEAIGVDYRLVS